MASSALVRTSDNKVIAGVCGGLGRLLKIDPNIIRVVFVLGALFFQAWILYLVLWLVMPDDASGESGFTEFKRLIGSGSSGTSA